MLSRRSIARQHQKSRDRGAATPREELAFHGREVHSVALRTSNVIYTKTNTS